MISKVGMRQCLDRAAHLPFADEQRKVTRLKLGRDEELLTDSKEEIKGKGRLYKMFLTL